MTSLRSWIPFPSLSSKPTFTSKVMALTAASMSLVGPMDSGFCLLSRPQL